MCTNSFDYCHTLIMSEKPCLQCEKMFEVDKGDLDFYRKMQVPEPTLCPLCRMQRRMAHRNDRSLYHDHSALSGKKIISMYDPQAVFPVYEYSEWWSDSWDPFKFGRDWEPRQGLFEQFLKLRENVPRFNLFNRAAENCNYVNYAPHCKDCYLLFGSWFNENCLYGQTMSECRDCVDSLFLEKSELCYENIDCAENYAALYCHECTSAVESAFCYDCHNVNKCVGCWNLRSKEYYILNEPASKSDVEELQASFDSRNTRDRFWRKYREHVQVEALRKYQINLNSENSSGNFLFNNRNAKFCFSAYRSEDIAYAGRVFEQKDSYDFEGGGKGELLYENMSNDFSYRSIGCTTCEQLTDSHYCDLCFNCEHCFACIGLRKQKYCILNKQYQRDEYLTLLEKIKIEMQRRGEWGEFWPPYSCPFAYNETMAQEYFPLSKKEALSLGYCWKDKVEPHSEKGSLAVPDNIDVCDDSFTKERFACSNCSKAYKVVSAELNFYRKMKIPPPVMCHDCRHAARMSLRPPRTLLLRECSGCGEKLMTSYLPNQAEKIVCESCYQEQVF